ncbi:DUF2007 domain-containing protein [Myroides sp. 1354]|uniref:putative signal transducing protein n=1 Tax=unclassified Myroides TaxID=2642485 RepID=UPI002577BD42|nr:MULTISPECIES: DUF2007 domain-containing protein [unclassified Myroides]MDM1044564.1 DUF2007 domain-containing protein [Myroides sp. R163-1]MDM1055277.1 DUF2007 domain-containing protein [Myroides sp. 1354]MDM1068574.1 DUF2007 domain-containing protein [Myroides sp. 1372]
MNHKKLFAGSEVMVLAVRNLLEENNIAYIIRDDIEAGRSAGYGTLGKAVHVLVEENDLTKAEALLKENGLEE